MPTLNPDIAVIKSLLERNANINYYDDEDEMDVKSPLLCAIDSQNYEIVDFLLQQPDIDVNIVTNRKSINFTSITTIRDLDYDNDDLIILLTTIITRIVVEHGLDIDIRDDDGMTPLLSAAYNANEPIARILIQLGADLTAQDDEGYLLFSTVSVDFSRI
jgi:ankyrin repeat protein